MTQGYFYQLVIFAAVFGIWNYFWAYRNSPNRLNRTATSVIVATIVYAAITYLFTGT